MRIQMKVIVLLSIVLLAAAVVTGCLAPRSADELGAVSNGLASYGGITIQQSVNVIVALQDDPRFVLLDIRTSAEVEAGHLSGAVHLDFYSDTFRVDLASLDRELVYLIYCRSGNRSGQAFKIMEELGFEQVYDMGGGISQWIAADYPICLGPLDAEHSCTGTYPAI